MHIAPARQLVDNAHAGTNGGHIAAMHRWDSQLRPPSQGIQPLQWSDASAHGLTPAKLRSPKFRRSSFGLYIPSSAPVTVQQRITEAAALLPAGGAIGGWASAYWRGVRLLDGGGPGGHQQQPVLLLLGADRQIRKRPHIRLSRERLEPGEVEELRGVRRSTDLRTAFDGARLAACLYDAVVFLDMMLTAGVVDVPALRDYWAAHPGWRGIAQARHALSLARRGSRSPPETELRLIWEVEAGLPPLLVNPPVFSLEGKLLGYPDGLDVESGTALEYDGDDHRDLRRHFDDNVREEWFEEHGLLVARAGRPDLRGPRRRQTRERLIRTCERGRTRDRRRDRWTLKPPPWWTG